MKMKFPSFLTPTSIFLIALAMGHAQYAIAGNAEAIKEAKTERDRIVELQRKQARTNGNIESGIATLLEQSRLIQERLWKMQNNIRPAPNR